MRRSIAIFDAILLAIAAILLFYLAHTQEKSKGRFEHVSTDVIEDTRWQVVKDKQTGKCYVHVYGGARKQVFEVKCR